MSLVKPRHADRRNRLRHAAIEGEQDRHADHRRPAGDGAGGHLDHARGDADSARRSRSSAPPTCSMRSVHAGCAWSRSKAAPAPRRRALRPLPKASWCRRRRNGLKPPARRHGALHLRPSVDCLTCSAKRRLSNLQDMAERGRLARRALRLRRRNTSSPGAMRRTQRRTTSSNPYFTFDPAKCIVCSRCVRACEEMQGTFALTISGRGFDIRSSPPGMEEKFMNSECVSCGACVQACPTAIADREEGHREGQAGDGRRSRPAPIAASAAPSKPKCAATK